MVKTPRVFRFTIGQGMTVIAALAVAFAIMPMPVAIVAAFLTYSLVVLGRGRPLKPTPLSRSFGCLFSFCGLVGGLVVGSWSDVHLRSSGRVGDSELFWIAGVNARGLFGGLTARILGRFLGGKLAGDLESTAVRLDSKRDKTQAQLKLVEHLLRRAHEDGDEEVTSKLAEFRAKLEHELQF